MVGQRRSLRGAKVTRRILLSFFSLTLCAALFAFAAPAKAAPQLTVEGRVLSLAGRPFFPVISWAQCAEDVEKNLAVGVNLFMQSHCRPFDALGRAIGDRPAWIIAPYWEYAGTTATPETNKTIGYHHYDEPDLHGTLPEHLRDVEPVQQTTRPVFMTLTSKFASEQDPFTAIPKSSYPDYAKKAHVLGFDLYPLSHFCYAAKWGVNIEDVYNYHRELTALHPGPTYQWIEMTKMEGKCGEDPLTAAQVRAEIWLSVAGGATAVAYFTHNWVGGFGRNFDLKPEIFAEVAKASRDLQALAPVLLAEQVPWSEVMARPESPVKVGVRRYQGRLWVVAVNSAPTEVKAVFGVKGAGEGRAHLWRQGRSVPVRNHALSDVFAPYATHVYELETKPIKKDKKAKKGKPRCKAGTRPVKVDGKTVCRKKPRS